MNDIDDMLEFKRVPVTVYHSRTWGEEVELDNTVIAVARVILDMLERVEIDHVLVWAKSFKRVTYAMNKAGYYLEMQSLVNIPDGNKDHWLAITIQDALDFLFGVDAPVLQ